MLDFLLLPNESRTTCYIGYAGKRKVTPLIRRLRRDIARANHCAAMCPVSTAIFLRIFAEAAWDELNAGKGVHEVTPFWRVIEPGSVIARKLRASDAWLRNQAWQNSRCKACSSTLVSAEDALSSEAKPGPL